MGTNNQGIMHLLTTSGAVACRSPRAIMAVPAEKFATDPKPCKRCADIFAKWQTAKAKRAAA